MKSLIKKNPVIILTFLSFLSALILFLRIIGQDTSNHIKIEKLKKKKFVFSEIGIIHLKLVVD